jgi:(E)-4-hydroxy-3-methylbut-2-enyl-diphosphate synthase
VADVHFNAAVADTAALYVDKVRINPGNYVDPGRTFKHIEYTDEEYAAELERLEARFTAFLNICKENKRAIRIGVNHGSLSDRIMSRYGDTPEGMVESCMEFLRVCVKNSFSDVVISIKASNTVVMVRTVRLLVEVMESEGMSFPLHLGVTEAGEGEDGRVKSALGIGALLADGYGDTIRVSLSEAPEDEIPVAKKLRDYIVKRAGHQYIPGVKFEGFDYLHPSRRVTKPVLNIGGDNVPVVIADRMDGIAPESGKFVPDYIYSPNGDVCGNEDVPMIIDADQWKGADNTYPAFTLLLPKEDAPKKKLTPEEMKEREQIDKMQLAQAYMRLNSDISAAKADAKFLFVNFMHLSEEMIAILRLHPEVVVVSQSNHRNRLGEHRALVHELMANNIANPVVIFQHYNLNADSVEDFQVRTAADMGPLIFDGMCDGIYLFNNGTISHDVIDSTSFAILQAGRLRTTKTEYISCPGCGRTLYDLQTTIAKIKAATSHLKGLKIAIMGCIVNGPGEMADADYGYVGAGVGKVSLYRKKECIEKNIPQENAVEHLLRLIESDMAK